MNKKEPYWCINKGCGGDSCLTQCDFCKKDDKHYQQTGKPLGSFTYAGTDIEEAKKQTEIFINNLK